LSGFFDGKGTVTATRQARKDGFYFQLRFVISNTEFNLIYGLMEMFGGSIHISGIKRFTHWKQVYMWHVESRETCLYILRGMLPYLRYKKPEAELAIEFFDGMATHQGQSLSNNERARRIEIVTKIRDLPGRRKFRGPHSKEAAFEWRSFTQKCKRCGNNFERETAQQAYCSSDCRYSARK